MTEKQTRRRRGFIFVKFADEEAVDVCTKEKFHIVAGVQACDSHVTSHHIM